jgi:hypothetical protein
MVRRTPLIILLVMFLLGCRPATSTPTASSGIQTTPTSDESSLTSEIPTPSSNLPGVSAEQLKNSLYQLGATNVPREVQLVNGVYQEGAAGNADFVEVHVTDGTSEATVLVSENYGGSGVFVFLALYTTQNNKAVFQASVFVDDRPQIQGIAIENHEVQLDVTVHGMDEPMCCPTLHTTRRYRLINNQLDMTNYVTYTPDGDPRTITIESPANRTLVSSSVLIKGSVAIAPFENNLTYSIKDGAGVELSRGAVPVTAAEMGGPGTFEALISLGKILSNTVIFIEIQDVSAADDSLLAMDSVELVVK